jgi:hypothetical protein
MSNKRVSELNELQAIELQPDDLTLVTDVSVFESKKLRFQTFKTWVLSDPGSITASRALTSDSASYLIYTGIPNGTASYAISSSHATTASWADNGNFCNLSATASCISGNYTASRAISASYALTSSYAVSASWADRGGWSKYSETASYIWYTGVPNGTASHALTCASAAYATTINAQTASYITYNGTPNGTSSYSITSSQSETASYLYYNGSRVNGTASFAISSSRSEFTQNSETASYLYYNGSRPNGTASFALNARNAIRANSAYSADIAEYATLANTSQWAAIATIAYTASFATSSLTSSVCIGTSSYAIASKISLDPNQYRMYGPYSSTDSGGTNTTTEQSIVNFVILPTNGVTTVIVMALCDVKIPITTTDTDLAEVSLYLDYTEPGFETSFGPLDTCRPNNYINLEMTGGFSLSGYNRQSTTLGHSWPNVSGSWYKLSVRASGGATLDTNRGTTFFVYTRPDTTLTKTAYPPY